MKMVVQGWWLHYSLKCGRTFSSCIDVFISNGTASSGIYVRAYARARDACVFSVWGYFLLFFMFQTTFPFFADTTTQFPNRILIHIRARSKQNGDEKCCIQQPAAWVKFDDFSRYSLRIPCNITVVCMCICVCIIYSCCIT